MIVDSGFRCHLTNFTRATAAAPSVFVAKLRKYLRTRRVTSISQVGTDRIIEIQFSDGQYRIFLEFYAGGNIVLTDKDLVILNLLRVVGEGAEQEELRIGLKYSLSNRQNYNGVPILTEERVRNGLQKAVDGADEHITAVTKKSKKKSGDVLRKALATSLNEFPPVLIDHALRMTQFDPNTRIEDVLKNDELLRQVILMLEEAQRVVDEIMNMATPRGYIIAKTLPVKPVPRNQQPGEGGSDKIISTRTMYDDYHPFRPRQYEDNPETTVLEFDGFNKAVDEFYSSIEGQKLESRLSEREENAKRKLETAKQDHEKRLGGLQQMQEMHVRKAQAIEANLQKVQEAVTAINSLIGQGMDWVEIGRLIEMEQARHNTVAEIIKLPLKLYENAATLLLTEVHFDDEEDFEGNETDSDVSESGDEDTQRSNPSKHASSSTSRLAIDIDLALSPWSNARQYYDQKKVAAVKEQKTLQSSTMALKSTEKKINADLKKGLKQEKQVLRPVRQQLWFEKFLFFISSESYLILGGRDAQQNEILYKKHLKKGDVYVHADLQGASSIIIKNIRSGSDDPIPPSTLSQAGILAVATSTAWESKAVMAAWWVNAEQVSKTSSSGEYLASGGFAIRGQKNYLPPAPLILGFCIMFHISEESKARHLKHRLPGNDSTPKNDNGDEVEGTITSSTKLDQDKEIDNEANDSDSQNDSNSEEEENLLGIAATRKSSIDDEDDHGSELEYQNPLQPNAGSRSDSYPLKAEGTAAVVSFASEVASNLSSDDEASQRGEPENALEEERESNKHDQHGSSNSENHLLQEEPTAQNDASSKSIHKTNSDEDPVTLASAATPISISDHPKPSAAPTKPKPQVRGKKGKYNKMKTKYANQDDEDRALAMRLLGSSAAHEKAKEEESAKKAKEEHLVAQKQRRQQQHALAAEKGKAMEAARQRALFHGTVPSNNDDDDQTPEPHIDLEAFVGSLLPGDDVLDALVMCGPWDAVGARCAWKAKLQPGTTKKGKAVREILSRWTAVANERDKQMRKRKPRPKVADGDALPVDGALHDNDDDHDEPAKAPAATDEERSREKESAAVRNFREQEVVGVLPVGKCRVVMAGGGGGNGGGGGKGGEDRGRGGAGAGRGKGKRGGRGSKRVR